MKAGVSVFRSNKGFGKNQYMYLMSYEPRLIEIDLILDLVSVDKTVVLQNIFLKLEQVNFLNTLKN